MYEAMVDTEKSGDVEIFSFVAVCNQTEEDFEIEVKVEDKPDVAYCDMSDEALGEAWDIARAHFGHDDFEIEVN